MKTRIFSKKRISNYKKYSRLVVNGKRRKYTKQRGGANKSARTNDNRSFKRISLSSLKKRTLPILSETNSEKTAREKKLRENGAKSMHKINSYSIEEQEQVNVIKRMNDNNMTIIEVSSLYLGIAYFTKSSQLGFGINIFNLHVDLLQYIINNSFLSEYQKPVSKLETIFGKDNNTYLCINNLPCLTCSTSPFITYKKTNNPLIKGEQKFYNVYEPSLDEIEQNPEKYKPYFTEEECYNNYQKLDNEEKKTTYECRVYESLSKGEDKTPIEKKSVQDIEYVRLIANYLSASKLEKTKLKCDFSDIPEEYVIIDDSINIEGIDYLICGYPEPKTMKTYIQLLNQKHIRKGDSYNVELEIQEEQEPSIKDEIDIIHKEHKTHFSDYMCEMYNSIPEHNTNKITDINTELYKFNYYNREYYIKYMIALNKEVTLSNDTKFTEKYTEMRNVFNNEVLSKYFNKTMMDINYIFLVFKKKGNKYIPAFYNFKELQKKDLPILNKIQELITKKLPELFKIIKKGEDYKLFFSYYPYGDFFHIRTKYLHTMSNIFNFSYKYANIISLEELIYMLENNKNLNHLHIDYKLKSFRLKTSDELKIINQKILNELNTCDVLKQSQPITEKEVSVPLELLLNQNTKIVLIYKDIGEKYTIIYKSGNDNNFYVLEIESNLCNIIYDIINIILKKYIEKENNIIYKNSIQDYIVASNLPLFKVIKHNKLTNDEFFNYCIVYNPITMTKLGKLDTPDIKLNQLINSEMISMSAINNAFNTLIKNPYQYKPFVIRNMLNTLTYVQQCKLFKDNFHTSPSYTYRDNKDNKDIEDLINKSSDDYTHTLLDKTMNLTKINRIYFNPENCGYNFIELCEVISFSQIVKKVVWIVPLHSSSTPNMNEDLIEPFNKSNIAFIPNYLRNFLDLNGNHIKMLNVFLNIYLKDNNECNLNTQSIEPVFQCLHIHVNIKENYSSKFTNFNKGSRLYSQLSLKQILNNLLLNNKYYNDFNININTNLY
jgi:hypothetical protein